MPLPLSITLPLVPVVSIAKPWVSPVRISIGRRHLHRRAVLNASPPFAATGGSFWPVMVTVTVAVDDAFEPSVTV